MDEYKRWLERWACSSPAELEAKLGELASDAAQLVKLECELDVFRALVRRRWAAIAGPTDANHLYDAYTQGRDLLDDLQAAHPMMTATMAPAADLSGRSAAMSAAAGLAMHAKQCRLCSSYTPYPNISNGECNIDPEAPIQVGAYFSCARFTEKDMCCQNCEHWRRLMTGNRCGAPGHTDFGEVGPEFVCDSWKAKGK